ncbi:MAG: hypothetical protein M3Q97_03605, partial [Bacteroidota bacterium]|nr:hypothetical protein [Bacteroidota bacterium]
MTYLSKNFPVNTQIAMKRILIATFVGALIVFLIQALSWMVSPIHANSLKSAANSEVLMTQLQSSLVEDGVY